MKNFILFFMVSFSCLSQQLIKPPTIISNPATGSSSEEQFGASISISGNYAVIGLGSGKVAYVYEKTNTNTWILKQSLAVAGLDYNDYFGTSVSIDGNTIVIGASGKDDPSRPGLFEGAFYIYERNNNNVWEEKQQIFRENYPSDNNIQSVGFAESIAIHGSYIIVGGITSIVSVYVKNPNGTWEFLQELTNSDLNSKFGKGTRGGEPLAITNEIIAIGDFTGGEVYMYKKNGNRWLFDTKILAPNASIRGFGDAVALKGNELVVGAPFSNNAAGAVCFYKKTALNHWEQNGIFSSNTSTDVYFGDVVALSDSYALINANSPVSIGGRANAHFLAKNNNENWKYIERTSPSDNFGTPDAPNALAINENEAFVGISAFTEAVYVFDIDPGDPVCTDVSIPDTVFEQWLVDNNKDSDGLVNGRISSCDAEKVTEIFISALQGVTNLTGINAFKNLETLSLPENDLVTLDLSNNTKLISLNCYYNLLEQINITNCNRLLSLNLSDNFLTGLDISGINDLQSLDTRHISTLNCIKVKDLAEATAKSSGRRPKWRVDNRSTIFNLNCPASKTSITNSSKKDLRNSKNRSEDIIVFPTHIANGEKLTVLAEGNVSFDVSIYDLQGNLFKESKKASIKVDLDISKFSPGMYIVKVNRGRNEFIKKIIVAK
ncbi:T9SS type A sorting domain-containing protein [Aquimarina muelleri]|uniref:T9SS type A sorting domain-containing protein n=1 Tax=Aquimarina muelleri TaxID=279356 RepID=UPI003F6858EF